ncbi:MAG: primosomal protein N' [Betaproteobacteria bacterium]|nr:MAG: primosomal protein N' [Betaproteobacteria bacterium]
MSFIQVAVDVPLATLFDYRCPQADRSDIGFRVRVPFGRKHVLGVILAVGETPTVDSDKIRLAGEILRDMPPLPEDVLQLLRFCSHYYHHPIGEVVHAALPARYRRLREAKPVRATSVVPTQAGRSALQAGLGRSPVSQRLLGELCTSEGWGPERIGQLSAPERRSLKRLIDNGWANESTHPSTVPPAPAGAEYRNSPAAPPLTGEQREVLNALADAPPGFQAWLLHGVTGSGKTEIYLQAMAAVLERGDQVLFLVPEIGLTPQLEARIRARFPRDSLVTMHSNLATGQRASAWEAAHAGRAKIILGTRSAVFAPMPRLALIVVDEEHDASFKQIEGMRYSARDLAVWRAHQRGAHIILGSATPSLESYQAALSGRYRLARLTRRANDFALPAVRMVAVDREGAAGGLAPNLIEAIRTRLSRGEQVLVFINRRGYAPVLVCTACSWAPQCRRCSARLVLHRPRPRMACHHCGHEESVPRACAQCGNADLHPLGYGTQRVEAALQTALPHARILRVDRDTTRGRSTWTEMRARIERCEVDILIGTQLLSKGHDFPSLGLVCILNADQSLYSTDFRTSEQLFAQLTQVAGRAGRGQAGGEVLIQTQFPSHPLYQAVQAHDFDAFARLLLEERRQANFPPFVYQAVLRAEATRLEQALALLRDAVEAAATISEGVAVFDPAPAAMQRLKGRERAQLLVQSDSRVRLHAFLDRWVAKLAATRSAGARWSLDVDPLGI